ncbi:hypothetical protein FIBSPDRAFT_904955 [Athelia psychrophila]|uniref:Uncharacterized protein n=1 Tax=Athelia psychrophila TaxID=1759441 RepID=A0A167U236_9AGAM|nr:hypothetical protein FIBSPDRAFT_904955 [Fibularhizoctonia sp. CBS 109695]
MYGFSDPHLNSPGPDMALSSWLPPNAHWIIRLLQREQTIGLGSYRHFLYLIMIYLCYTQYLRRKSQDSSNSTGTSNSNTGTMAPMHTRTEGSSQSTADLRSATQSTTLVPLDRRRLLSKFELPTEYCTRGVFVVVLQPTPYTLVLLWYSGIALARLWSVVMLTRKHGPDTSGHCKGGSFNNRGLAEARAGRCIII